MIGAAATFEALGTYVYLATRLKEDLALAESLARKILVDIDETCSRFRPDSDLTMINSHPGEWVDADLLLVEAIKIACDAARQTDGLVNPLLGRPLVALGYDRTFRELRELDATEVPEIGSPLGEQPSVEAWLEIELNPEGAVKIPRNTALDLGATAKAWSADLIASALGRELTRGAIVSVGGDIAIASPPVSPNLPHSVNCVPWPVAISEHPDQPAEENIQLSEGGLATSSTQVRQWHRNGVRRHHLLDPRTGLPCAEVWRTVTATGPTCTAANIASTAALVLGDHAIEWLNARAVTARLVAASGEVYTIGAWGSG